MLRRFRGRATNVAQYNFYVWEGGSYVQIDGGRHGSDHDAATLASEFKDRQALPDRPDSLDRPHLHVIREDGVHILTLEISSRAAA